VEVIVRFLKFREKIPLAPLLWGTFFFRETSELNYLVALPIN
jgi:hypothetical protein